MKALLAKAVRFLGLASVIEPFYETWRQGGLFLLRRNLGYWWRGAPDRQPIPPLSLIYDISGSYDLNWFFEGGRLAAQTVRDTLSQAGYTVEACSEILDFGCGCGRVLRHWSGLNQTQCHGTDPVGNLVDWGQQHLAFANIDVNPLDPPTRYRDQQFDLVYALSVFTHLVEPSQKSWMQEMARILKPGGLLLMTTHGDHYLKTLDEPEVAIYQSGRVVVLQPEETGLNSCMAYHPEVYLRETLSAGFEVLSHSPGAARGNPVQDVWLLQKVTAP